MPAPYLHIKQAYLPPLTPKELHKATQPMVGPVYENFSEDLHYEIYRRRKLVNSLKWISNYHLVHITREISQIRFQTSNILLKFMFHFTSTYLVPKLLHLRWPGTNLPPDVTEWSRREPAEDFAGDKLSDAMATASAATDSFELDELGAAEGGSNFKDNLKGEKSRWKSIYLFQYSAYLYWSSSTNFCSSSMYLIELR